MTPTRFDAWLAATFRGVETLVVLLALAMIVVVFVQVVLRYSVNFSFYGSEEFTRLLLIWFVFLSAALGVYRGSHFEVDTIVDKLPEAARRWVKVVAQLIVVAVILILLAKGTQLTIRNWRQLSPAMQVPVSLSSAAVPVSALLMLVVCLRNLLWRAPADAAPPVEGQS